MGSRDGCVWECLSENGGWERSGGECSVWCFLMFFDINILFTFIFVWCAARVVTGGVRGVFVGV